MSDVTARFKAFLWDQFHIDPQSVVVRLGANGKVHGFGVSSESGHTRALSGAHRPLTLTVDFEGGKVAQEDYDGCSGVTQSRGIPR